MVKNGLLEEGERRLRVSSKSHLTVINHHITTTPHSTPPPIFITARIFLWSFFPVLLLSHQRIKYTAIASA